jgi:hypothetical protein
MHAFRVYTRNISDDIVDLPVIGLTGLPHKEMDASTSENWRSA